MSDQSPWIWRQQDLGLSLHNFQKQPTFLPMNGGYDSPTAHFSDSDVKASRSAQLCWIKLHRNVK